MLMPLLVTVITFICMEGITWLSHKFLMHGFMWKLHEDHHNRKTESVFEKNDTFFIIFAIPSILLFALGTFLPGWRLALFIGLGIFFYGLGYFLVHDIFIHQRLRLFTRSNNFYLRAIRKAHKMHHKHLGKEEGECFGMLWVPLKYFREELRKA